LPKLVVAVVHDEDAGRLSAALREEGLPVTRLPSRGGFLGAGNSTFMLGLEDQQVATALKVIEHNCQPHTETVPLELLGDLDAGWMPTEVTHGGATVFVLEMAELRRI
jgi:uncharacterized protein YaaQ